MLYASETRDLFDSVEVSKLSENKENSQTYLKVICKRIKWHISKRKMQKTRKKVKIIVDIGEVLRYNVTRWRQTRFGD